MINARQKAILEIVEKHAVSDQNSLLELLRERGINAAQATISRDIRKLNLKKTRVLNADGSKLAMYVVPPPEQEYSEEAAFSSLYRSALVSIDSAQNIIVVKTKPGMAQAVCAAFDSAGPEHIVGSLAGDDTFFIVCKTSEDARHVMSALNKTAEKE